MQMERDKWNEPNNGCYDKFLFDSDRETPSRERSPTMPSSSVSSSPPRHGYIEHPVSKLDTLVGIAIKYGVEVLFCFVFSFNINIHFYLL